MQQHARTLWADGGDLSRYMVGSVDATENGTRQTPAVVHVNGTTRPQELREGESPEGGPLLLAEVLQLGAQAGVPALVNTSFNGQGEPIVYTALDAVDAFLALGLDFLVLDSLLVTR